MSEVQVIDGEIFNDERGQISSLNNFHFEGVRRGYFIHHPNIEVIRGWHGHQYEKKWFSCIKGEFILGLVKIDNWEMPSSNLIPQIFKLSEKKSQIVCVPDGYANILKATIPNSVMLVLSGKVLEEALKDSWRYDKNLWIDWDEIENL